MLIIKFLRAVAIESSNNEISKRCNNATLIGHLIAKMLLNNIKSGNQTMQEFYDINGWIIASRI
jgi:hypothetical protein